MAVSQPNVTIELTVNTGCSGLSLTDVTGLYDDPDNTGGYGLPSGPGVNDVVTVTVILSYNSLSNDVTYVFTVSSGTITAATLAISSGTPVSILTELPSTVWPFTDPFDLTDGYGITLPDFEDDVYSVSYTIEGTVSAVAFEFEAVANILVECQTRCCIDKKWLNLDPDCCCENLCDTKAFLGEALLKKATYSAQYGDLNGAVLALNKAKALCNTLDCRCG